MVTRASRYATWSQLSLALFSFVCVILHPGFVLKWDEGGFSNYGVHVKTAIPYSLAFALCAFFALRVSATLPGRDGPERHLGTVLRIYAVLMMLTLLSTYGYTLDRPLKSVHTFIGIVTMLFEPLAAIWMYVRFRDSLWFSRLIVIELVGLVLGVIDFSNLLHVLFVAQVVTGVGFGFIVVQSVSRLGEETSTIV
jgi:hypothetical protein